MGVDGFVVAKRGVALTGRIQSFHLLWPALPASLIPRPSHLDRELPRGFVHVRSAAGMNTLSWEWLSTMGVYFLLAGRPDPWLVFLQTVIQEPEFLPWCSPSSVIRLHVAVWVCVKSAWGQKVCSLSRLVWDVLPCPGLDTEPHCRPPLSLGGRAQSHDPIRLGRGWQAPCSVLGGRGPGLC